MNYTVIWLPDAERELATVWVSSRRQAAVTRAVDELERRLARNAPAEGESRANGRRIAIEPPLAIIFRVDPAAARVTITRVWEFQ
jgi:hypothetical protein